MITIDSTPLAADVHLADCCIREILGHVTSKQAVLVLAALAPSSQRWAELRRGIGGISEKILTQTLRTLQDRLAHREAHPVIPPRVDYSLTPLGAELAERLLPVVDWIEKHAVPLLVAREARKRYSVTMQSTCRTAVATASSAVAAAKGQQRALPGQTIDSGLARRFAYGVIALEARIVEIDQLIAARVKTSRAAELLQSLPGFGPLLAAELLASTGPDLSAQAFGSAFTARNRHDPDGGLRR